MDLEVEDGEVYLQYEKGDRVISRAPATWGKAGTVTGRPYEGIEHDLCYVMFDYQRGQGESPWIMREIDLEWIRPFTGNDPGKDQ